jgi:hypothetical protein
MDKKSQLGYSKDSPYKDEPYININSNKITMKDTEKDLLGVGIKDGKIVKVIPMKAGKSKDYDFGDVDSVLEIPSFQGGGGFFESKIGGFAYQGQEFLKQVGLINDNPFMEYRLPEGLEENMAPGWAHINGRGVGGSWDPNPEVVTPNPEVVEEEPKNNGTKLTPQEQKDYLTKIDEDRAKEQEANLRMHEEYANSLDSEGRTQREQELKDMNQEWLNGQSITQQDLDVELPYDIGTTANPDDSANGGDMDDYNKNDENKTEMLNSYGGIDLETAFSMFGRGLGEKEGKGMTAMFGAKAALGATRNMLSGFSSGQMSSRNEEEMKNDAREYNYERKQDGGLFLSKEDIMAIKKFQNGGKMELSKKLTGDYMEGLANENPEAAVVEAEDGEFVLHNDGQVVEIKGNKHGSKGGEKMTNEQISEGDRFISNHLKLPADKAKELGKQFGVKLSTKDTYSDAIRKVRKEIGLTKISEEKEELIQGIEKIQKTGKEDNTHKLNLEFQTGKLNKLYKQEEALKGAFSQIVETIYDVQESTKKGSQNTQEMKNGGYFDNTAVTELAKKHGLDIEKAMEIVKQFENGGEKEADRSTQGDPKYPSVKQYEPRPGQKLTNLDGTPYVEGEHDITQTLEYQKWHEATYNGKQFVADEGLKPNGMKTPTIEGTDKDLLESAFRGMMDLQKREVGVKEEGKELGVGSKEEEKDSKDAPIIPMLPDQSVLPPGAMAAHAKNNFSLNRVEGSKISPEQYLAEIGSQMQTAMSSANERPDSARAAILAQMLAGTQGQANKAIGQANMANQQSENQINSYNSQISDKEQMMNAQERLRFEQMQMRAKENTDLDMRDFVDYNRKVQLNNYNTVEQKKLLNELFEKYEYVNGEVRMKGEQDLLYPKQTTPGKKEEKKKKS